MEPSVWTTQVCSRPAAMLPVPLRTGFSDETATGDDAFFPGLPVPSLPSTLYPQHHALPSDLTAHVWLSPEAIAVAPARAFRGIDDPGGTDPVPSWPARLSPQHVTSPFSSKAQK